MVTDVLHKSQPKDVAAVAARAVLSPACMLPAEQDEEWTDGQVVAGVLYKAQDGAERVAHANLTVVCDGMYSSLRRKLSTPSIAHPSYFVGLLLQGCALPHANYGHVVLGTPSPILFYPISSCEVGCCLGLSSLIIWECRHAIFGFCQRASKEKNSVPDHPVDAPVESWNLGCCRGVHHVWWTGIAAGTRAGHLLLFSETAGVGPGSSCSSRPACP